MLKLTPSLLIKISLKHHKILTGLNLYELHIFKGRAYYSPFFEMLKERWSLVEELKNRRGNNQ